MANGGGHRGPPSAQLPYGVESAGCASAGEILYYIVQEPMFLGILYIWDFLVVPTYNLGMSFRNLV